MGFANLHHALGGDEHLARARHFLEVLIETRCANYEDYGWGYPFDWQTLRGRSSSGTPLITTTPYVYEAFAAAHEIDGDDRWLEIMQSSVRHVLTDIYDTEMSKASSACSYSPRDERRDRYVINASAYRAWMLTHAAHLFDREDCRRTAERNLNFVLEQQKEDGSWPYATDQPGQFIDNFHTCFVMKSLAKIEQETGHEGCSTALERGAEYYWERLLDERGLPRPFAKEPRLTLYRYELYDFAECLNLALLLRGRFTEFQQILERVLDDLLNRWRKPDGSFRTRKLLLGWNNVPMHRWGQAQLFRSLSMLLREEKRASEKQSSTDAS